MTTSDHEEGPAAMTAILHCPHDGTPLAPLADTPRWFRCGAGGWKHYFYRNGSGELVDVDTDAKVPQGIARPVGRPRRSQAG